MARLQGLGVRTWEISVEDAAEELPGLNTDGIGCVAFEPDSGYADARGMARAFVAGAGALGAEAYLNTRATGIALRNGLAEGVATDKGTVRAPVVVIAAGPWSGQVGRWAGLELPLEISREQDIVIRPPAGVPTLRHSVSNMVDRTYFRPESGGLILAGRGHPKENEPANPDGFRRDADQAFIRDVTQRMVRRFPALEGAELVASWAGLYDITPDWNMMVGEAPGVSGLYLAVGGSGHSFKLAPAIGLCLAELIVEGRASTVDIAPLRPSRFEEGAPLRSTYGGNRG
jgi:glycine/D-amino acid oxidase-like deaminating enzyme